MAINADRPWVRQYVRKALSVVDARIDAEEAARLWLEDRVAVLEDQVYELMNGTEPPEPPDLGPEDDDLDAGMITDVDPFHSKIQPRDMPVAGRLIMPVFNLIAQTQDWREDAILQDIRRTWTTTPDGLVNANVWIIVRRGNRYHAATFEWLRIGQTSKGIRNNQWGDHIKVGPLKDYVPHIDDEVYMFISTMTRAGTTTPLVRRSHIAKVKLV